MVARLFSSYPATALSPHIRPCVTGSSVMCLYQLQYILIEDSSLLPTLLMFSRERSLASRRLYRLGNDAMSGTHLTALLRGQLPMIASLQNDVGIHSVTTHYLSETGLSGDSCSNVNTQQNSLLGGPANTSLTRVR